MKRRIAAALASVIAVSGLSALSAGVYAADAEPADLGISLISAKNAVKNGWLTKDGKKYYYKNGTALTGWYKIGGDTYFFSTAKNGQMLTSWAKIGKNKYYFGSDGVMRTGWVKLDGDTYYFGNDGVMRTGTIKTGTAKYTFGADGKLKSTGSALDIPWKITQDDLVDQLEEKDKDFYVNGNKVCEYKTKTEFYVYSFDKKGKLSAYAVYYPGGVDDLEKIRKDLKQQGFKLRDKHEEKGSYAYFYMSSDSVVLTSFYLNDDDEERILTIYLSPDASEKVIEEGDSAFADFEF